MIMYLPVLVCLVTLMRPLLGDRYHGHSSSGVNNHIEDLYMAEHTADYWYHNAQSSIEKRLHKENFNTAKNVIMFLGDGLSVPTMAAARILLGQRDKKTGEESELFFENFPIVGLSKTYCVDAQIADSACSATAYLCGVKNNDATLGVTAAVRKRDCLASTNSSTHVDSIAAWALADGRDAGIVTTTRVTHASPAGAYAKSANRDWESDGDVLDDSQDLELCPDIAYQLINTHPGKDFKVILGGGRREFIPNDFIDEEGKLGRRRDGKNLIEEWKSKKEGLGVTYEYVWNRTQLLNAGDSQSEYILGLFEDNHMQYNLQANAETEPTLTEMTEVAIKMLSRNEKGYFLFIESGRIDHAHHDNLVHLALDETIEMANAVKRATELVNKEDTLIVVTADHSHVMAFNGYTPRGTNIIGTSNKKGDDDIPFMTLSYTNGPGARDPVNGQRSDVTQDSNFMDLEWPAHAEVILDSETHGGDDVAVFARGPHHHLFTGLYEQSHIPHLMAYASCLGPGRHACSNGAARDVTSLSLVMVLFSTFAHFFSKQ